MQRDDRPQHGLFGLIVEEEQPVQQHGEGEREIPAGAPDRPGSRDRVALDRRDALLGRFEVGLDEQRDVIEQPRHDRGHHDRGVGRLQEFGDQEGGGAHHRRHQLAAGRGHRLDGAGLVRGIRRRASSAEW